MGEDYNVDEVDDGPRPFTALLDTGLKRTSTGSKVFAALKVSSGFMSFHTVRPWPIMCPIPDFQHRLELPWLQGLRSAAGGISRQSCGNLPPRAAVVVAAELANLASSCCTAMTAPPWTTAVMPVGAECSWPSACAHVLCLAIEDMLLLGWPCGLCALTKPGHSCTRARWMAA